MRARSRHLLFRGAAVAALLVTVTATGVASGAPSGQDRSRDVQRAIDGGQARNVILLIGDGMGDSEITLARNYEYGAGGRMALDTLPLTGAMTTYSVLADGRTPDYTPESASTATAWSTGSKTVDGRISTDSRDRDLPTVLDQAERSGLRTGVVTTSELTDATPAAPMSHVTSRTCQGPADMVACPQDVKAAGNRGGPGSIAEQSIDHDVDVLFGGGRNRYEQTVTGGQYAGRTVVQQAQAEGYRYVTDERALRSLAPARQPVLGLFAPGNLATRWEGPTAARPPVPATRCNEKNPAAAAEPALDVMTRKAIDLLAAPQGPGGNKGFFLQVESASIDKQDHAAEPCEQIGETVNFDRAVKAALEFAAHDRNTLVIVTGDHAHTSQIVEVGSQPAGFSSILTTDEGAQMQVTYGTGSTPNGQGHTGSQIRVAAQGPQAANVVGVIDQTEIATIMRRALRL
jgi:alkaline phosphatase